MPKVTLTNTVNKLSNRKRSRCTKLRTRKVKSCSSQEEDPRRRALLQRKPQRQRHLEPNHPLVAKRKSRLPALENKRLRKSEDVPQAKLLPPPRLQVASPRARQPNRSARRKQLHFFYSNKKKKLLLRLRPERMPKSPNRSKWTSNLWTKLKLKNPSRRLELVTLTTSMEIKSMRNK